MRLPTVADLEVPQRPGEVICVPPGPDLLAAARANAELLAGSHAEIGGVPLPEFRARVRSRLLALAAAYTAQAGIALAPYHAAAMGAGSAADAHGVGPGLAARGAGGVLVVTGHQPYLFHPGIWIKHLMVDHLAGMGAVGVSMSVDSDGVEEIGVEVPSLSGRLHRVREVLVAAAADVPYESLPAPSRARWADFVARVDGALRTLPTGDITNLFARFAALAQSVDAGSIGEFITIARRRYEGPRRYLELPVSRISGTEEFRTFVLHIAADAERFAVIYNRHLRAYRERYNIRTTAQPFPDLEVIDDCVELPFWLVRGGRRLPLYVRVSRGARRLLVGTTEVADLSGTPEVLRSLAIRPRALTLTAFTRLCAADLFVHGIGGARYDRVTDEVIREYFGLEPPAYAVLTATLHLPLPSFDTTGERHRLQRRLLELQHNPERVLTDPSSGQRGLIEEKWTLIRGLERLTLPRRARRDATQRIRQINDMLAASLAPERDAVERRLAELQSAAGAEAAATARTYPFCFFAPQAVDDLVAAQFREPGDGV